MRAIAADTLRRDATIDELASRYHLITPPVVIVFGTMDRYLDAETQSSRFARTIPAAHVRMVENAGHQISMTHPMAVVEAVHALSALTHAQRSTAD
jgi:pimeloyl-ACP methyl ester carboxylesterase